MRKKEETVEHQVFHNQTYAKQLECKSLFLAHRGFAHRDIKILRPVRNAHFPHV